MTTLTRTEQAILDDLKSGMIRADIARKRGVTRAAVTHTTKGIERKGYAVPEADSQAARISPMQAAATIMLQDGKTVSQVSDATGFSPQWVRILKRKMEGA